MYIINGKKVSTRKAIELHNSIAVERDNDKVIHEMFEFFMISCEMDAASVDEALNNPQGDGWDENDEWFRYDKHLNAFSSYNDATIKVALDEQYINEAMVSAKPKRISVDNGVTYETPTTVEEAAGIIKRTDWEIIAHALDAETCEIVNSTLDAWNEEEFLLAYLKIAPYDVVIG